MEKANSIIIVLSVLITIIGLQIAEYKTGADKELKMITAVTSTTTTQARTTKKVTTMKSTETTTVETTTEKLTTVATTKERTTRKKKKSPSKTNGKKTILLDNDRELLACILYCEARGMNWDGQVYTCSAILNLCDYQHRSLDDLGHDPQYFAVADQIDSVTPNQMQYDVIDYVISGGRVPDICYFRMGHYHDFGTPVCEVDGHYFSKP